jgi:site-specific DNA-methyltransferase (adenine-specific)
MVEPYYQQEGITIYHADCRDILPHLEPVDLVLTSPPYDNLRDYGGHGFDYPSTINSIVPIIKDGGVCVWVVGDETVNGSESGTSFRQALYFMEKGLKLHDTMIYEKINFSNPSLNRYQQIFEFMFIFCKGNIKTFNPLKDRQIKWVGRNWGKNTYRKKDGSLAERKKVDYAKFGMRFNIWKINNAYGFGQKDNIAYQHPATFPVELAYNHIYSWSNKDDLVLDPMCGSGTTLKIAKQHGRKAIGIEIEERYVKIAIERLRQKVLPL